MNPILVTGCCGFIGFHLAHRLLRSGYSVVGIDHSIAAGEFKSSVKLVQLDSYGKFESIVDVVNDAVVAIEGAKEEGKG